MIQAFLELIYYLSYNLMDLATQKSYPHEGEDRQIGINGFFSYDLDVKGTWTSQVTRLCAFFEHCPRVPQKVFRSILKVNK